MERTMSQVRRPDEGVPFAHMVSKEPVIVRAAGVSSRTLSSGGWMHRAGHSFHATPRCFASLSSVW